MVIPDLEQVSKSSIGGKQERKWYGRRNRAGDEVQEAPSKKSRERTRIGPANADTPWLHSQPARVVRTFASYSNFVGLTCTLVVFAASLLASLSVGYALGAWSSDSKKKGIAQASAPNSEPAKDSQEGSDSEEEDAADGDLSAVKPGFLEPCKLVSRMLSRSEWAWWTECLAGSRCSYRPRNVRRQNCCTVSVPNYVIEINSSCNAKLLRCGSVNMETFVQAYLEIELPLDTLRSPATGPCRRRTLVCVNLDYVIYWS